MPTIQDILEPMQTVLRDATARAGATSGFIRRPAMGKMSAETFVSSLVFACMGETQPTLDDFAANSATMGAPVSPQAFDDRFSLRAVACLRQVLETARAQRIRGRAACRTASGTLYGRVSGRLHRSGFARRRSGTVAEHRRRRAQTAGQSRLQHRRAVAAPAAKRPPPRQRDTAPNTNTARRRVARGRFGFL